MKYFRTQDIYIASTLLTLDFPIVKLEKEGNIFYFIFKKERELLIVGDNLTPEKVAEAYWTNGVKVEPNKLFNSFKHLKGMMYRR